MAESEAHRHRFRSPIAAIIGLADAALLREELEPDLRKHLRAIRALAQQALEADDLEQSEHRRARDAEGEPEPDR